MQTQKPAVGPLKKISMKYTAGSAPDTTDLISSPASFEFIFGLGVDGLTPFEYQLEGKSPGDIVQYLIERSRINDTFGHLLSSMGELPAERESFYLNLEINGICDADQRELVSALAATTSCGGDCDCGCGGL